MKLFQIGLLLSTAAAALGAQAPAGGTATIAMSMRPGPDNPAAAMLPAGTALTMEMIYRTDGTRAMIETVIGGSIPMIEGMRSIVQFRFGSDTVVVASVLPPQMAASAGMPGTRMEMTLPSMAAMLPGQQAKRDSATHAAESAVYRSLGTTSTVAGLRCEEWEIITAADTTRTCAIPTPPALAALSEKFSKAGGMASMLSQGPRLDAISKKAYNGRAMTAIRTDSPANGLHMELTGFTVGAPSPESMELPAGLQSIAMPGGGGKR